MQIRSRHSGSPPARLERSPGRGRAFDRLAFDKLGLTFKVKEFVTESHQGMPCRLPHGYRGPGHRRIGERAKAMPIRSGKCSEYQNIVEPHSGQKCCSIFRPESPLRT